MKMLSLSVLVEAPKSVAAYIHRHVIKVQKGNLALDGKVNFFPKEPVTFRKSLNYWPLWQSLMIDNLPYNVNKSHEYNKFTSAKL